MEVLSKKTLVKSLPPTLSLLYIYLFMKIIKRIVGILMILVAIGTWTKIVPVSTWSAGWNALMIGCYWLFSDTDL